MSSTPPQLRSALPLLAEDAAFWKHCARGELRFQRCSGCGEYRHPPSPLCAHCRAAGTLWELAPDEAELFSYTVVHHAASPTLRDAVPYNVAIVAFPTIGGVRIVSTVIDAAPSELKIGMLLRLSWQRTDDDWQLPVFLKRFAA